MFRKYKPFFRAGAMETLAYKFNIFGWLIVSALQVVCVFFLWIGVYKNSPDQIINGFTLRDMLVYTAFINVFNFVTFAGDTMYSISQDIKNGTIAMSFVKPISYRVRFIFTTLGGFSMNMLLLGLPAFVLLYVVFGALGYIVITSVWMFLLHLLLFVIAQMFAVLLYDCINYICGVLCFYTTAAWGMNAIKDVLLSFLGGTLIPLSFFPGVFKEIVSYSPFAGISQNPVLILTMKMDVLQALQCIALSLGWLCAMELVAWLIFRHASKKVTVQGG
ncbi:MAG: ABC-2 family transporter protein [Clostridiales bacterium]|nr:ABC-2 family transporter protein [Clostridiales bacterium]